MKTLLYLSVSAPPENSARIQKINFFQIPIGRRESQHVIIDNLIWKFKKS
jgi:hypothetical protein